MLAQLFLRRVFYSASREQRVCVPGVFVPRHIVAAAGSSRAPREVFFGIRLMLSLLIQATPLVQLASVPTAAVLIYPSKSTRVQT